MRAHEIVISLTLIKLSFSDAEHSEFVGTNLHSSYSHLNDINNTENMSVRQHVGQAPHASQFSVPQQVNFACAIVMTIMCAVGIAGNLLSIFVYGHPRMRSSINVLLLALSCADLALSILTIPVFSLPGLNIYFEDEVISDFLVWSTVTLYPVACMTQSLSVWLMVIITGERYTAICHPLLARRIVSIGRAKSSCLCVVLISILYNTCRYVEFQVITVVDKATNQTYPEAREWMRADDTYFKVYYVGTFLITHFVVPFAFLVLFNIRIVTVVRNAQASFPNTSSGLDRSNSVTNRQKKEHRIALMVCVIIGMFLVCNTLPFGLNFAEFRNRELFNDHATQDIAFIISDISNTLVVLNSASTFMVYMVFSERYRTTAMQITNWSDDKQQSIYYNYAATGTINGNAKSSKNSRAHEMVPLTQNNSNASSPSNRILRFDIVDESPDDD